MKKSYNTKKPLSMLPLLALASFNTSMYSMEVVQPKALQVAVFIARVENNTNKDLTITIDGKDHAIEAGEKRKLDQQVSVYSPNPPFWSIDSVEIKHKNKVIAKLNIYWKRGWGEGLGMARFDLTSAPAGPYTFDSEEFATKSNKSYEFGIQLTLEGENLEKSEMEIVAVEK